MIKRQRPEYGDLVITKTADGFWTYRPPFLDDSHTPSKVDTLEAAIASAGLSAYLEQVDLWLLDDDMQFRVLVNGRKEAVNKTARLAH